jgi:hypothetical protein
MTAHYTIEKGKSRSNVFDAATGEFVCQLLNREVRAWLDRAERAYENNVWWAAREKELRLAKVQAYLAARAIRGASRPKQLNLF